MTEQHQTDCAKLREAERLIYEVREEWSRTSPHINSSFECGMLAVAQKTLDDVLGLDYEDEEYQQREQARNEARLLWAIHRTDAAKQLDLSPEAVRRALGEDYR